MFVGSIDLREAVSSSISLLAELLLSSWLWIIVNNCNTKCNILGQAHVVCCEYSENWERWLEVADISHLAEAGGLNLPTRHLRAFFPSQPTEFGLAGGLYTYLQLGRFTKARKTKAVSSALIVNPPLSLVSALCILQNNLCFITSSIRWWLLSCVHE